MKNDNLMLTKPSGTVYWRRLWLRICRHWQVYVFLFLPVAFILLFHYYPMTGIQLAFKQFDFKKGIWCLGREKVA